TVRTAPRADCSRLQCANIAAPFKSLRGMQPGARQPPTTLRGALDESRNNDIITPRRLKGFRDSLPDHPLARQLLRRPIRAPFESSGSRPITTPALDHAEILRGKGSDETDRLLFEFRDHGDRAVGMRFDLTVPLARFVAEHQGELTFPLRVYQIGTV